MDISFEHVDEQGYERVIPKIGGLEMFLLHILLKTVPDSYEPGDRVLAMAAGCGDFVREGSLIRALHKIKYGIERDDMVVIGSDYNPKFTSGHDYDFEFRGSTNGDCTDEIPWILGINRAIQQSLSYDFIYVGDPAVKIEGVDFYKRMFKQGLNFLSPKGVLVSISEGELDKHSFERLKDELESEDRIIVSPVQRYTGRIASQSSLFSVMYVQKGSE